MFLVSCLVSCFFYLSSFSQEIAVLKYKGGGDWYGNPTALPNLIKYCNNSIKTKIDTNPQTVETGSTDIFQFPFIHMTGHGNVFFDDEVLILYIKMYFNLFSGLQTESSLKTSSLKKLLPPPSQLGFKTKPSLFSLTFSRIFLNSSSLTLSNSHCFATDSFNSSPSSYVRYWL